jgi:hypothetical protein
MHREAESQPASESGVRTRGAACPKLKPTGKASRDFPDGYRTARDNGNRSVQTLLGQGETEAALPR